MWIYSLPSAEIIPATSTVMVISPDRRDTLLHFHKIIWKEMPCGGKFERWETSQMAAGRELYEESGVDISHLIPLNIFWEEVTDIEPIQTHRFSMRGLEYTDYLFLCEMPRDVWESTSSIIRHNKCIWRSVETILQNPCSYWLTCHRLILRNISKVDSVLSYS